MSKRMVWFLNIGLLILVLSYLFVGVYVRNPWMDVVLIVGYFVAGAIYFVVQMIRHRGGNEVSRLRWLWGPDWWKRFGTDDFERPKNKGTGNPSSPHK